MVSLILGIISLIFMFFVGLIVGLPAVICGHVSRCSIRKNPELEGAGLALAGLITGYVGIVGFILIILLMVGIIGTGAGATSMIYTLFGN